MLDDHAVRYVTPINQCSKRHPMLVRMCKFSIILRQVYESNIAHPNNVRSNPFTLQSCCLPSYQLIALFGVHLDLFEETNSTGPRDE